MVWCISSPYLASSPSRLLPDSCGRAQDVLGVRSEYPLSILRNLTRPPPCFCVVCTPSPLEGRLGTAFRPFLKTVGSSEWAKKAIGPGFRYGNSGKKARKRPFSGVPQDPGKGVFFGLCLGSLKPAIAALWL